MDKRAGTGVGVFMRIVVLGGAGFMGSAICRFLVADRGATVLNVDRLGPTSSLASLAAIASSPRYSFRRADIADRERIAGLLAAFSPDAIVHAAADHRLPDRVDGAAAALAANVTGTWRLLETVREHWSALPEQRRDRFRLVSVSAADAEPTPASAARAAGEELVKGWFESHGLPAIVAKAADTLGPFQFPDSAIPAAILAAIEGRSRLTSDLPARPWLCVDDHARAIALMLEQGTPGRSYAVAGKGLLDPASAATRLSELVERHRACNAGAVRRDAVRPTPRLAARPLPATASAPVRDVIADGIARLEKDTGWRPEQTLDQALARTVRWYLANEAWWRPLAAAQSAPDDFGMLRIA